MSIRNACGLLAISLLLAFGSLAAAEPPKTERPNIVVIYGDDVGYGDLGCYGAKRIKTPNLDKLAASGLRFTDAHCTSATCTPSRYGLLTGQYPWRKPGTGILPGDANLIIDPTQLTLPRVLQRAGYKTGAVGKWHLGLGKGKVDWNGDVKPGPLEIGFDYSFLIPATGDRVPCVYLENHRVVGLDPKDPIEVNYQHKVGTEPTGKENPDLLKVKLAHGHDATIVNGISRIGWMTGGTAARWVDEDMADVITDKAVQFIEKNKDAPFFLYFSTQDIHVPRAPHKRFAGGSETGVRGDVMQQLDACAGRVMEALDKLKLTEKTIVIFTSDNGPVVNDGYLDGSVKDLGDHKPAGPLRGGKYAIYEGGTRVPMIARWPGKIKPGTSAALVCQLDFLASFAALTGEKIPEGAKLDSENQLPALLGEDLTTGRALLVEHANGIALRKGHWKYIPPGPKAGPKALGELFDLSKDLGETKNLAAEHPEVLAEMGKMLEAIRTGK